jgi:hypothetical protein
LIFYGMWLLFVIAALMMTVFRSAPARTGSLWLLGCAVLAFALSFALRDVVRKVGHRNTEDQIVRDVQTFLERQPALPIGQPAPAKAAAAEIARPAGDAFVPGKSADFVPLKGARTYGTPPADPVVFDTIPSRGPRGVRKDFYAVLFPVKPNR